MQNIKTLAKFNQFSPSFRYYTNNSTNLLGVLIGKWNKFWYGGEQPYNSRDIIYEQMIRDGKSTVMLKYLQKILYARDKARKRYVKHNEHVRKLEDKIGENGLIKQKSFANRF